MTIPGRVLFFWTHQQGMSRHHQNQNPIFAIIRKMYHSITNSFPHITRAAHAITLVRGSHPYRRCSVPLKEFILIEIYLKPLPLHEHSTWSPQPYHISIYRVIKAIYALYMHVHTNDVVISQCNSIANNKNLPPIIWQDHPCTRFGLIQKLILSTRETA